MLSGKDPLPLPPPNLKSTVQTQLWLWELLRSVRLQFGDQKQQKDGQRISRLRLLLIQNTFNIKYAFNFEMLVSFFSFFFFKELFYFFVKWSEMSLVIESRNLTLAVQTCYVSMSLKILSC